MLHYFPDAARPACQTLQHPDHAFAPFPGLNCSHQLMQERVWAWNEAWDCDGAHSADWWAPAYRPMATAFYAGPWSKACAPADWSSWSTRQRTSAPAAMPCTLSGRIRDTRCLVEPALVLNFEHGASVVAAALGGPITREKGRAQATRRPRAC